MNTHNLPGKPISYWIDSTLETAYPRAPHDLDVDVAVVGAGIVGITTAYLLKQAGQRVALIEADRICSGVSGHTTAKLTALHELIYSSLLENHGEEKARLYGESNLAAIEKVAQLVRDENIDCDFSRTSAYTFSESASDRDRLEAEAEAAIHLGLPAKFVESSPLHFPIAGAVCFENQAQFHPRKYLLNLAHKVPGEGSYVFENTRVREVKESEPCRVVTDSGTLTARDVVVTTNLPILDKGLYFAKTFPKRSYLVGAYIDPQQAPEGVHISLAERHYRSIRTTPHNGQTLLMIGGEGHKTGSVPDPEEGYRRLEDYARQRFGVERCDYRWSSQDFVSFDSLPFIGQLTPTSNHVYMATGFGLWGMTKGTMSAMLLSDLVLGRSNPWAELYDSTRATPFVSKKSVKNNFDVASRWVGDRFKGKSENRLSQLQPGEGELVNLDGEKVAAYRKPDGELETRSAVCPHLGCIVDWNAADRTWECPCHGSRFSCDGDIIQGPAVNQLDSVEAPETIESRR